MKQYQNLYLEIPVAKHEKAYSAMMDRWEALGEKIAPQLLSRGNASYSKWLVWCEDDRTTGSMLETKVPCTLYFLMNDGGEILGSVVINHDITHRGHIHLGIAPWHRGNGYGTAMLALALDQCRSRGFSYVEIVPYKGNDAVVKVILRNGGVLVESFCEDGVWSERYAITL